MGLDLEELWCLEDEYMGKGLAVLEAWIWALRQEMGSIYHAASGGLVSSPWEWRGGGGVATEHGKEKVLTF